MPRGKVRHMFAGGNTSKGFFSFYNNIVSREDATKIFILKGGPGTGKSTFIGKTAEELLKRGYDAEYIHCSADCNSLDGVVFPQPGIAVIDGTAPHLVDPLYIGVRDEIINIGSYLNEAGILKHREEIFKTDKEKKDYFARAYRYLEAAGQIYHDSSILYGQIINIEKINMLAEEVIGEFWHKVALSEKYGRRRSLFASAITPGGLKNYLDDLLTAGHIYVLEAFPGAGTENFLQKAGRAALERGCNIELYYCALNPHKLEHLIVPGIDLAFTTENKYHATDVCTTKRVNFNDFLYKREMGKYRSELEYNEKEFERLLDKAIEILGMAKAQHDKLEAYYFPYMDFNAIQGVWEGAMERILGYIKVSGGK